MTQASRYDPSVGCLSNHIHLPPDDLDGVLAELRRAMAPAGTLVVGFLDGDELVAFEHKVVRTHFWPVDAFAERLRQAGFTSISTAVVGDADDLLSPVGAAELW